MVERRLGAFGSLAQGIVQCLLPAPGVSRPGEPEQAAFGLLDDGHGAVFMLQPGLIGIPHDILAHCDQLTAHMQVIDRTAAILGIDDRDDAGSKLGEIFRTANMLKVVILLKIVLQGDRTRHLAALG
jgi:hypothetical protein